MSTLHKIASIATHALDESREHLAFAVMGIGSFIVGGYVSVANVIGAEIPDGIIASAVFLLLSTISGSLAWLAVRILEISKVATKLETRDEAMAEDIAELKQAVARIEHPPG